MLPTIESFPEGLVFTYGSKGHGKSYAYTRSGKLVGATVWSEEPFGECRKLAIHYTGGAIPEPAEGSVVESCKYVPGRRPLEKGLCRCAQRSDRPPLVGLDRGPLLKLSLDCLYELGAAGTLCLSDLDEQRDMPEAVAAKCERGRTRVSSAMFNSDCVYDRKGKLIEMRLGKRYVSEGFDDTCRR